jgi:hypothetical protein
LRLYRQPRHGTRGRRLHGRRAELEGRHSARHEEGVPVEHTFVAGGYRTQLFNPEDLDNVYKVQAAYKVQTLSAYLNQPPPARPPAIDFPKIDKELVETNFFEYLDLALQFAPAKRTTQRSVPSSPASASVLALADS